MEISGFFGDSVVACNVFFFVVVVVFFFFFMENDLLEDIFMRTEQLFFNIRFIVREHMMFC